MWQFRRLTLLGKITVIKSLLASQLVYILSPLPSSHHNLKEIKDVFLSSYGMANTIRSKEQKESMTLPKVASKC